jgi:SAM-dependent methyltransferase
MIGLANTRYGFREPLTGREIAAAYELYFGSGLYDRRYPSPNPHSLGRVLREIGRCGGRVLDFGCGSGRYAVPLAQQADVRVTAYDVCHTALGQLGARATQLIGAGGIIPVGTDLAALEAHADASGPFDVVLLAFGVLGHIPGRTNRQDTLRRLCAMLRPGGSIVLSVPNAARRFRREQKSGDGPEPGDVEYMRHSEAGPVPLFYHVYRVDELIQDLTAAGFARIQVDAESVLPERGVISSPLGAWLDGALRRLAPLSIAYGFLARAERPHP